MKAWPILGILIVQSILCLAHWFLYITWLAFWWPVGPATVSAVQIALTVLSFVFMVGAVLGFRFTNWLVALLYQIAAVWLGLMDFLLVGSAAAWISDFGLRLIVRGEGEGRVRPWIAVAMLAGAVATSIYGILNAKIIRIQRKSVQLDRLPASWRGRTALLVTDVHLGNINGIRFARKVAALAAELRPDVIFVSGDLFDGTKADPERIAAPLLEMKPPLGVYFVSGNHEEFGGTTHYTEALRRHGAFHVLDNERVLVDGLQLVGVSYAASTHPMSLRHFLTGLRLSGGSASILLQHVPNRLPIAEQAGVGLMLCGHTHKGQMFPFTWVTRRAFGEFTYGLHRFGMMQVLTSSGVGTWGPPMRVGTDSEVVLLTFE